MLSNLIGAIMQTVAGLLSSVPGNWLQKQWDGTATQATGATGTSGFACRKLGESVPISHSAYWIFKLLGNVLSAAGAATGAKLSCC